MAVGGVLMYAGFMKATGPAAEFAANLAAYKLFPSFLVSPLSLGVPYLEMWVGLFVFAGLYSRYASFAAAALFTAFVLVLGSALLRGIDLTTCGCFGSDTLSPRYTILMDIVLLALSLMSAKINRFTPSWSLDKTLS